MSPRPRYQVLERQPDIDLDLSRNEGWPWSIGVGETVLDLATTAQRYPSTTGIRDAVAECHGVDPGQVLITAGGDDALFRCLLARSGQTAVATTPTFEMIARYAEQARCKLTEVSWWDEPFPVAKMTSVGGDIAMVVSPNNPTGQVISAADLQHLAAEFALVLLDAAYSEFADVDLTSTALQLSNVVVIRTLSKAFGLAGLRIGYVVGPVALIDEISRFGSPYPVSGASVQLGEKALRDQGQAMQTFLDEIKAERVRLIELLEELGATPLSSQANFVLATSVHPERLVGAAAARGVLLRHFPNRPSLSRCVRITVPGAPRSYDKLASTLNAVLPAHRGSATAAPKGDNR